MSRLRLAAALAAAGLLACGGQSSSSLGSFGNTLPQATGPGDAENLFPDSQGCTWSYAVSFTGAGSEPSSYFDTVSVTGTKAIDGQLASVFLESNSDGNGTPLESYYLKNSGGLAYLGDDDTSDALSAEMSPYLEATFPVTPGTVAHFSKSGINFGEDLDGDGKPETTDITFTATIDDFEPLTIGMGSFARTLKFTQSIVGTVTLSASGQTIPYSATVTNWTAPNVGLLRSIETIALETATAAQTTDARGYFVNGAGGGIVGPYPVASGLAPGDSNYADPGPPALAADGQNFIAIAANDLGMRAMVFDVKGAPFASLPLAGGATPVAAFDGTNYWVVFSESNGMGGFTCLAQRITPAGALLDATSIPMVAGTLTSGPHGPFGLAFGGEYGLLVYTQFNASTSQNDMFGVLVAPSGTTAGGPFPIAATGSPLVLAVPMASASR